MSFRLSDISLILLIGIVAALINYVRDPIKRFGIVSIVVGIVSLLLLVNLPSTSFTSEPQPGQGTNELINIIQQQREALLKLKQVILGFVIQFVVLFLPNLHNILELAHRSTNRESLQKEKADWERQRARGKKQYILTRGVLYFLYLCLVVNMYDWILNGRFRLPDLGFTVASFMTLGVVYVFGCYFALCQWDARERSYGNSLAKMESDIKENH